MRLTNKSDLLGYTRKFDDPDIIRKITRKLGQLEDVEEELGIDLVTLFKAFEEDIWIKRDGMIIFVPYDRKLFVFYEGNIYCELREEEECVRVVSIDDYGKTWALTKEELL